MIHEDLEEDEDAPTRIRDAPTLLAQLALLEKSEPPGPPSTRGVDTRRTPVVQPPGPAIEPPRAAVVAQAPPLVDEPPPVSAPILPFDRESAPPAIAVPQILEPIPARILEERPSAPILPFDRESAPPRSSQPIQAAAPAATHAAATHAAATHAAAPAATHAGHAAPVIPAEPVIAAPAAAPQPKGISPLAIGLGLVLLGASAGLAFFLTRPKTPVDAGSGSTSPSSAITAPASTGASPGTAGDTAATVSGAASAPSAAAATTVGEPSASGAPVASGSGPEPQASTSAAPSAAPSTLATAAATASAATAAGTAAGAGVGACMVPLFAAATFITPPSGLDAACQITDPREGVKLVKNEVIRAGGGRIVSDGMREWAIVGWYGMASFAAVRATCCPSTSPELHIPFKDATCDLDGALKRIAAAATSATAEDTEVATALQAYTKAVKCTVDSGAAAFFRQKGGIVEGELVTFQKTLARTRAAAKNK